MKIALTVLFLTAVVSTSPCSAQSNLPATATTVTSTNAAALAKRTYIVTLRPEGDQDACANEHQIVRTRSFRHALNGFVADLDEAAVQRLRQDARVRAVEADCEVALADGQTTPTGVARMGIPFFPVAHYNEISYWDPVACQSQPIDVDVAVLDSGIDLTHPDLNVFAGADFTGTGNGGDDCMGHGTMVAGVIGAINNTFGVIGVAPGVRLWAVQVVCAGSSSWANVLAGMDYISQHADQISVANASLMSIAVPNPYVATQTAVETLVSQGVVFVAGAGNGSRDIAGSDGVFGINPATGICDDILPAALPQVMAVSAMDVHTDQISQNSNFSYAPRETNYVDSPGGAVDVAAPGYDSGNASDGILTTAIGGFYGYGSATSIACPHVAGLVALYIAANGRATNAAGVYAIRQAIVNNSLPQSQWNNPNPNPPVNGVTPLPAPLAMPSENWVPQPIIAGVAMTVQGFQLSFQTVPGYTYTVQYCSSLGCTNQWAILSSTNGNGSLATVTLLDPTPEAARFYQVASEPAP